MLKPRLGSSSNKLQGLGLKKKSEYDKPTRKRHRRNVGCADLFAVKLGFTG